MKLWGSLSELVSLIFRKDSQQITVRPNQATTYTGARDIQLPPGDAAHVLTSASSTQTLTNKSIDADTNTITNIENADIKSGAAIDAAKLADGSVSNTEFQYIGGLTSDAQTQLNAKLDDFSSSNDNRLVRTNGTAGDAVQESVAVLSDAGALSGVTQLSVDNVDINGNTVSSTTGDLNLNAGANVVNLEGANVFIRAGADLSFYDNDNTNAITISVPTNVTTNRTPQIPDDTGNFVLDSATQTLTNKTLTSATLDDYFDINEESAPGTPAAGKVRVYAKTDQKLYTKDSNGVEQEIGSGSGQGEKNYIENSSAASAIAGWTAVSDLVVARTTTLSELPREFTTGSGIKITADADTQSVADYVYYDFTLDDVDLNKKLKIQWSQKQTGTYVAGDLAVIITTQADRTTAIATPDVTAIPAYDGVFTASFDTTSTATLSLVIRATTDMATNGGIVISDVIVGPGQIVNAAPIGPWISYTPAISSSGGSVTLNATSKQDPSGFYRRVGDSLEVQINFKNGSGGAASGSAGTIRLSLPTGLTADTSLMTSNFNYGPLAGSFGPFDGTNFDDLNPVVVSSGFLAVVKSATSNFLQLSDIVASYGGSIRAIVPIAEWAGAPNYAGQNDVQYVWNSDISSTATVTTGSSYGPSGVIPSASNWSVGTEYVRRVTFLNKPDLVEIETSMDGVNWAVLGDLAYPSKRVDQYNVSSKQYGMWLVKITDTTWDVYFGNAGRQSNNTTYGGNGSAWSNNFYWRVTGKNSTAAVGFGLADTTRSGLIGTGTQSFAGNKTFEGSATLGTSAGNQGHQIFGIPYRIRNSAAMTATVAANVLDFTGLPAGIYTIAGKRAGSATGTNGFWLIHWTGSAGTVQTTLSTSNLSAPTFSGTNFNVTSASTATHYFYAQTLAIDF